MAGPLQVFATANQEAGADYVLRVVAVGGGAVTTSSGVALVTVPVPEDAPPDTLIVAGGPGVHATADDQAVLAWLRARGARARRVVSVCTGAFLLAAAGLLDGRRATTHWAWCERLARRYPSVRVEPDPIFVCDGDVWTSAGVTAGVDLALALLEADHGRAVSLAVARHLVVFLKRPGGQAQFSDVLALQSSDERFAALHEWLAGRLGEALPVVRLASECGMSERSFSRRYVEATGSTPAHAVERLRVQAARRLLLETQLPVKRIAQRCGFGAEERMRRSFLRLLGTSPLACRERFSG